MFDLSEAVSSGHVNKKLARRKLGALSNVRWTIYAARFLRLYTSTKLPTYKLICIVRFIQNVYVPMLLTIKCNPTWTNGPQHVFKILSYSQKLSIEQFNVVKERIHFNSYFMHSENIIQAMAVDKDEVVRSRAYEIIMTIRRRNAENESSENNTVRIFTKPTVHMKHPDESNFDPTDSNHNPDHYSKLFDWSSTQSTFEPPFIKRLSVDDLKCYKNSKENIIEVPALPCHSQATEYNVQIVKNIVTKYMKIKINV